MLTDTTENTSLGNAGFNRRNSIQCRGNAISIYVKSYFFNLLSAGRPGGLVVTLEYY